MPVNTRKQAEFKASEHARTGRNHTVPNFFFAPSCDCSKRLNARDHVHRRRAADRGFNQVPRRRATLEIRRVQSCGEQSISFFSIDWIQSAQFFCLSTSIPACLICARPDIFALAASRLSCATCDRPACTASFPPFEFSARSDQRTASNLHTRHTCPLRRSQFTLLRQTCRFLVRTDSAFLQATSAFLCSTKHRTRGISERRKQIDKNKVARRIGLRRFWAPCTWNSTRTIDRSKR